MKRDWNKDSRLLTPTDAKQVVAIYRAAYGVASAKDHTLIEQATRHGHRPEITAVFEAELATLDDMDSAGPDDR